MYAGWFQLRRLNKDRITVFISDHIAFIILLDLHPVLSDSEPYEFIDITAVLRSEFFLIKLARLNGSEFLGAAILMLVSERCSELSCYFASAVKVVLVSGAFADILTVLNEMHLQVIEIEVSAVIFALYSEDSLSCRERSCAKEHSCCNKQSQ